MNGKKANVCTRAQVRKTTGQSFYSLPICSEIFERLIYNKMFTFFTKNTLYLQINLDLDLRILVVTNYLLLPKKYINFLMRSLKL